MSSHSRSSSEVETVQYREILPVHIEAFFKDFSFDDVKHEVKGLFTIDEYDAITNEKDEKLQIRILFWTLYQNDENIKKFLKAISYTYSWLVDAVEREYKQVQLIKNTENYIEALRTLRRNNQKHTDYNVHRIEPYEKLRRALKTLTSHRFVVLTGDLGMGKKWLTVDVCSEYEIQCAMNFKIYWIDVSQCTSREADLRALQQLRLLLGDTNFSLSPADAVQVYRSNIEYFDNITNRILDLQLYLSFKLRQEEFKNALIILSDVKNEKTWKAFNLGCKLLLITRNKTVSESLSPTMTTHIEISEGLTLSEFYRLFKRYLGRNHPFPPNASDIYYQSKGHPYLLSIIGQNLRQRKLRNWDEWITNLQNLRIDDNKFAGVIDLSLNVLQQPLLELYATLAIFPHSILIPVKLLAALWHKSEQETEKIVSKFHKYSIASKAELPDCSTACTVPFIYSSHIKNSKRMQDMIDSLELHRKVIAYYKIEDAFNKRTEIDLCNSQHDLYFYQCIGYHIYEVQRTHLFEGLYLDFGFLGQKMRAVGFLNTIGDLKYYKEEIINGDPRRRELLNAILEFLPNSEDMLVRSADTSLLQYALMANGPVYEEALRQAKQFPEHVWFNEIGLFHQRRQIVNLPNKPTLLKFLDAEICLIVLDNNDMILADLSLDYNNGPVYLTYDDRQGGDSKRKDNDDNNSKGFSNRNEIIEAQLIRDNMFLVTLDTGGELKLWAIGDDLRRSIVRRRSSKQKVNPFNFNHAKKGGKKCKQSIHTITLGVRTKIVAFFIDQLPKKYNNDTDLHVAYDSGEVCVFNWNSEREEFQSKRVPTLHTRSPGTRFLCKILGSYYMLLNKAGNISFWNLRDSSRVAVSFEWPSDTSNLLCFELYKNENETCIFFIFGHKILRLTFELGFAAMLKGGLETLYDFTEDPQSAITCGRLTRNGRYLVLGTKCGLIVFDTLAKSEILRSNVSEAIACVDIYSLEDEVYQFIIVCGSEHTKILNIFSLRDNGKNSVTWAHSVAEISCQASERPHLEPNVLLLGKKLYDIRYQADTTLLMAVDSKHRIHQVCTNDTENWSILTPTENSNSRITAITKCNQNAFVGFENGAIFNVTQECYQQAIEEKAISYLQLVTDNILIVSSRDANLTLVRDLNENIPFTRFDTETRQSYKLFECYLLLINKHGFFLVLDLLDQFRIIQRVTDHREVGDFALAGCDLKNNYLFIATTTNNTYVYGFSQHGSDLKVQTVTYYSKDERKTKEITCLTASNDGSLIATGYNNGDIEVCRMIDNNISFLHNLQSHTVAVNDLKFSPFSDVLVSCAEQLCFWHVSHMLNNPLQLGNKKRRSSRFSSQRSSDIEEIDAECIRQLAVKHNHLHITDYNGKNVTTTIEPNIVNHWLNKRGPAEKPELLACIKFVGNKAEKLFTNAAFTQFNTIDDEGVYYHLTLLEFDKNDNNGNNEYLPNAILPVNLHRISRENNGYATTNGRHPVDEGDDNVII